MREPNVIPFERSRPMLRTGQADRRLNGTLTWYRDDTEAWERALDGAARRLCYSTGIESLDLATCGLMQGNVTLVAGRTGAGKSSFALTTALMLAHARGPTVLYVSLEMTREDMALRGVAWLSGISQTRLLHASVGKEKLSDEERESVSVASRWFDRKVRMMAGDFGIEDVRREALELQASEDGLSVVILDHVGLVRAEHASRTETREREVATASRGFRKLMMELNVAGLMLAQLNRAAIKDAEPELHHLRDSGGLEQDASTVIFLWPTAPVRQDRVRLFVRKNRFGGHDTLEVPWDGATGRVGEIARRDE